MTTKLEQAARHALEALELFGTDDMAYIKSEKAITALREALAEQQITTPDVCGEVCARAKLCYGCNKDLEEANAKYVEQAEQEPVAEWEKLKDPQTLFVNLNRGFPAQLTYGHLLHLLNKTEQAEQEPEYDLSNVIHLTHNKAKHIIKSRGYSVTGFVLTREDGGKCIVDMSAVRWFDDKLVFQRMMHSDTPKEWLSPPVEPVKQEPVFKVGNLVTVNSDQYPALGHLFVQLWDGDDLIARVYADDEQTLHKRVSALNTAHVRTKDLSDDEIEAVWVEHGLDECDPQGFARAVIAADRSKNK